MMNEAWDTEYPGRTVCDKEDVKEALYNKPSKVSKQA